MVDLRGSLLIEIPGLMTECFNELKILSVSLPAAVMIGLCLSFFMVITAEEVIQKAIFAILFSMLLGNYYTNAVDYSFKIAQEKIKKNSNDNYLLSGLVNVFQKFDKDKEYSIDEEEDGLVGTFKKNLVNKFINQPVIIMCHFIALIAILGIKAGYTISYYLTVYLAWIPLTLYVFPRMNMLMTMMFTTCINTLITPYILACFCTITDSIITKSVGEGALIGDSIEGTVLLILFSWGLFLVPVIVFCLLNGSGISVASSAISGAGLLGLKNMAMNMAGIGTLGGLGKIGALGKILPGLSGLNSKESSSGGFEDGGMSSWGMDSKSKLDKIIKPYPQLSNSSNFNPASLPQGGGKFENKPKFAPAHDGISSNNQEEQVPDGYGGLVDPTPYTHGGNLYKSNNGNSYPASKANFSNNKSSIYENKPKYAPANDGITLKNHGGQAQDGYGGLVDPTPYTHGGNLYKSNNGNSYAASRNKFSSTKGYFEQGNTGDNNQQDHNVERSIPGNVDPLTGEIYEDENYETDVSINKDGSLTFNNRE